jgi:hypothetical protein
VLEGGLKFGRVGLTRYLVRHVMHMHIGWRKDLMNFSLKFLKICLKALNLLLIQLHILFDFIQKILI